MKKFVIQAMTLIRDRAFELLTSKSSIFRLLLLLFRCSLFRSLTMMTEIETIEGVQKDISSLKGTTFKKKILLPGLSAKLI